LIPGLEEPEVKKKSINYFSAWLVPGVFLYTMTYMGLKASTYGLLFWLPTYLEDLNFKKYSSSIASMMDVG